MARTAKILLPAALFAAALCVTAMHFPVTAVVLVGSAFQLLLLFAAERRSAELCQERDAAEKAKAEFMSLASVDALTGLQNRRGFILGAQSALARAHVEPVGFILLDIDRFKRINDTFGHVAGDQVLVQVARELEAAGPPHSLVARLGGEEFGVLTLGLDEGALLACAESMRKAVSELDMHQVCGVATAVTISAGVAHTRTDVPFDTLYHKADVTLYRAKRAGGDRIATIEPVPGGGTGGQAAHPTAPSQRDGESLAWFAGPGAHPSTPDQPARAKRFQSNEIRFAPQLTASEASLLSDFRRGLASGELVLHYQPKYLSGTAEIAGVEALVRWNCPARGLIPPNQFVPVVERGGDAGPLTEWVIASALAARAELLSNGIAINIAVNVPPMLVSDRRFAALALQLAGNSAANLGFEITESGVLDDPDAAIENLRLFAEAGIRLAIDDYGTGMSSLAHLKRLPVHELKIDKSFVTGMTHSHRDPLIVQSTIDLAHGLGMEVTAEGVESLSELELLKVMGCDLIQGFLLAKPMPLEQLKELLSRPVPALGHGTSLATAQRRPDYWGRAPSESRDATTAVVGLA